MKYLLLFVSLVTSISSIFAQGSNSIDAVSSASGKIRINSGSAYSDSAVLTTYHKYTYGRHWIDYGTTTAYGDQVTVKNSPTTQDVTLSSLAPDTKYYYRFKGDDGSHKPYSVIGNFTTLTASVNPDYDTLDAVSSASGKIAVDSGKVYMDSVVLYTYHNYTYGVHWVDYGTTTSYGEQVVVSNSPRRQPVVLSSLLPNTKYYYRFKGDDGSHKPYSLTGFFTTLTGTFIAWDDAYTKHNLALSTKIIGNKLVFSRKLVIGDAIRVVNIQGKLIFNGFITRGEGNSVKVSDLTSGAYFVTLRHLGKVMGSAKLLVSER